MATLTEWLALLTSSAMYIAVSTWKGDPRYFDFVTDPVYATLLRIDHSKLRQWVTLTLVDLTMCITNISELIISLRRAIWKGLQGLCKQQKPSSADAPPPSQLKPFCVLNISIMCIKWLWKQRVQAKIRLHRCTGWSKPSLSSYAPKSHFTWCRLVTRMDFQTLRRPSISKVKFLLIDKSQLKSFYFEQIVASCYLIILFLLISKGAAMFRVRPWKYMLSMRLMKNLCMNLLWSTRK